MIDFATIKPVLKALIATLSELDPLQVTWEDEGKVLANAQIKLKLEGELQPARDYETEEDVSGDLITTLQGVRHLPMVISFEVAGHGAATEANTLLSKVLLRLSRRTTLSALHAVELSITAVNSVTAIPWKDGQHVYSTAKLDLMFETVSVEVDDSIPTNEYIDNVKIASPDLAIPEFIVERP